MPAASALSAIAALIAGVQATPTQPPATPYDPPWFHDGQPHFEKRTETIGSFSVVRSVEDYRAVPMIHGDWLTIKAQLIWHDSSGRLGFEVTDNGSSISLRPESTAAGGGTICIAQPQTMGHDSAPSTQASWRRLQPVIVAGFRACGTQSAEDVARVEQELRAASADYIQAANRWKSVAAELFGAGGRRCIAYRMLKPRTMPPRFECARYSKPPD